VPFGPPATAARTCPKVSTRKAAVERPGLVAALGYVRQGDTLTVWKLDRRDRSVKEVLIIADDLHARGVGVGILAGKLSGAYSPTTTTNADGASSNCASRRRISRIANSGPSGRSCSIERLSTEGAECGLRAGSRG
jgi:hypothetical protein